MHEAARACKAGLVAAAALGVSMIGHLAVGGSAHVTTPLFTLAVGLTYTLCWAVPVRAWPMRIAVPFLAVTQVLLHYGMQCGMSTNTTADGMAMPEPNVLGMLGAHVLAIAAAAWLIRRGEYFIDALVLLIGGLLPARAPEFRRDIECVDLAAPGPRPLIRSWFLLAAVVRRGPPCALPTLTLSTA